MHYKNISKCETCPALPTRVVVQKSLDYAHILLNSHYTFITVSIQLLHSLPNQCYTQGLTNPLPGYPGQVLNPTGQVCSVITMPGRASVKKSPGQLKVRVFTVKKSDQKMFINTDN